jgi:hypothetical protein
VVERGDWAAAALLTIAPSKFGYAGRRELIAAKEFLARP